MITLPTIQFVKGAASLGVSPFFSGYNPEGHALENGRFPGEPRLAVTFFELHRPASGGGSLKS